MSKEALQGQIEAIIGSVPTDEDIEGVLGFDLSEIQGMPPILTAAERDSLLVEIRSETVTKETLRRILATISGAVKLAISMR